jgi:hypothetical protein
VVGGGVGGSWETFFRYKFLDFIFHFFFFLFRLICIQMNKKMMWNEETCELDDDRRLNISIVIPTACTQEEEEDDGVRCSNQLSV